MNIEMRKIALLYVIRSLSHFSYHSSTIQSLLKMGCHVILLYDPQWRRGYSDKPMKEFLAEGHNLIVKYLVRRQDKWRLIIFPIREIRSYSSYVSRKEKIRFYMLRWEGYLIPLIRSLVKGGGIFRRIIGSVFAKRFMSWIEMKVPPCQKIQNHIQKYAPDVIVVSPGNMRFSEEIEYLKAAKSMRIPTVIPVLSWDNLTTKGLIHVVPDRVLVWNELQYQEAVEIHEIPKKALAITGSPFLDKWRDAKKQEISRSKICGKLGLKPKGDYILYLGSSANIAKDESWIVEVLSQYLLASEDPKLRRLQILVRPHGANQDVFRKIISESIITWFRDSILPDTREGFMELSAAIKGAVCTVGLNTTAMIDAVLAGKPVITLLIPEYRDKNTSQAVHFKYILKADIYEKANKVEECLPIIQRLMEGIDMRKTQREAFIWNYIWPAGKNCCAGEIQAREIVKMALTPKKKSTDKGRALYAGYN